MIPPLIKYPRTHHIRGSRYQPGDEDLADVPFRDIRDIHVVVEEKVDGANAGICFDAAGKLLLQSRGHYLTGGPRERHFDLFKQWGQVHAAELRAVLTDRYVVFGEWLYAKHTVFYDRLPHYFIEFDIYDRVNEAFLDTSSRHLLLADLPILSVRVLHEGPLSQHNDLVALLGDSAFISHEHRHRLASLARERGQDSCQVLAETDPERTMEGLYIKVEGNGIVGRRLKYIRQSFLSAVAQAGNHWLDRPIIPNQLETGADLFAS